MCAPPDAGFQISHALNNIHSSSGYGCPTRTTRACTDACTVKRCSRRTAESRPPPPVGEPLVARARALKRSGEPPFRLRPWHLQMPSSPEICMRRRRLTTSPPCTSKAYPHADAHAGGDHQLSTLEPLGVDYVLILQTPPGVCTPQIFDRDHSLAGTAIVCKY